jgi:hypothetical protein
MKLKYIKGSRDFAYWIHDIEYKYQKASNVIGNSDSLYYTIDYDAILNGKFYFHSIKVVNPNIELVNLKEFIIFHEDWIISNLTGKPKEINHFYSII